MNINREEILLKNFTSGTTLLFFSTSLNPGLDLIDGSTTEPPDLFPTILEFNDYSQPVKVSTFDGENVWRMNNQNIHQPITAFTDNYITGHSFVQDFNVILTPEEISTITEEFIATVTNIIGDGEFAPIRLDCVFHDYQYVDDFYVNVNLKRTHDTLDTLSIYNNVINSMPSQQSDTGVVFGRLMARQNIKDESGKGIKIPLKNVPIGIFNPSQTYPASTSVDENGDRIFLNTLESAEEIEYFNSQSFSSDTENYLRSASAFDTVPDHYKYVTRTNENGEFVIYNVPTGTQTVIFEIDLFKQGLTKDEIALNYFPFPATDDANIDNIPSYIFKQFAIDIVPAWGDGQTGYTELNLVTNTDLRKWATFYIPPMAFGGNKLGSTNLTAFGLPYSTLEVRDMTKEGFPITQVPIVEIQDITDKEEGQTLLWANEFIQLKSKARYYDHGFKAIKVRANMYDPNGFRTDSDGVPVVGPYSQGVWLAGYQFKYYYNSPKDTFRSTGFQRDWVPNGWFGRDHFHLNRGDTQQVPNTQVEPLIGAFPYDKPWTHNYPEPYSIPSRPTQLNFDRGDINTRLTNGAGYIYLEQPEYTDGDLIGRQVFGIDGDAGGYGAQFSVSNNYWFSNRFSKEVTRTYIYKYEGGVAWNEKYACGFEPGNPGFAIDPGASFVVGGEKYQRVECGYGYWLRAEGWPYIATEPWGDIIFTKNIEAGFGLSSTFGPGSNPVGTASGNFIIGSYTKYNDIYNLEDRDIMLALDNNAVFAEGALDIYRIIDPTDIVVPGPIIIPTYATFRIQEIYYQRGGQDLFTERVKTAVKNAASNDKEECFSRASGGAHGAADYQFLKFRIQNNGVIPVSIPNTSVTLQPGADFEWDASTINLDGLVLTLPGNANYDFTTGKYQYANYTMEFIDITHRKSDGSPWGNAAHSNFYNKQIVNSVFNADVNPPNYYLITRWADVRTQYNSDNNECDTSGTFGGSNSKWTHDVKMNGALFETPNTSNPGFLYDIRFWPAPINTNADKYCGGGNSFNDGLTSIAIEVID
jgi:hypothetical protein